MKNTKKHPATLQAIIVGATFQTIFMGAALSSIVSCNNNQTTSKTMINSLADTSQDSKFLRKAAEINLEEIKVGQLAQQNGGLHDVKTMGKMLEDDHNKSWDELTALAGQKSISLPTTLDNNAQEDYKTLSNLSGNDFDKKFCDMMISGHKDAIALFQKESTQANDTDIRHWAAATIPTLQKHLDSAISCKETNK